MQQLDCSFQNSSQVALSAGSLFQTCLLQSYQWWCRAPGITELAVLLLTSPKAGCTGWKRTFLRLIAQISVQLMQNMVWLHPELVFKHLEHSGQAGVCKDSPTGTGSVGGWAQPFLWKQKRGCLSSRLFSSGGSSRVKACMLQWCGIREELTGALYFVSRNCLVVNYSFDFNFLNFF